MKFVFDLDDTILYSEISDNEYFVIGANDELINIINNLYDDGNEIIIHTARHWNHLQVTIEQLDEYGVCYDTVVCGKPVGDYYVDDKGIKPEDFIKILKEA